VEIAPLDADGRLASAPEKRIDCDLLCVSGGWSPLVHLHSHTGRRPIYDETLATFVAPADTESCFSAGSVTGLFATGDCLNAGIAAATAAVEACGIPATDMERYENDEPEPLPIRAIW